VGKREGALEDVVNPWQGRRVFLTGHTGFKGSWLALWLVSQGAAVRGFALDPGTEPNLFTAASVAGDIDDLRGDIRNYAAVEAAVAGFAPEVVFHLAAQPLVRLSYADPLGTYSTNVMGTAHVLESVRRTPSIRAVVCVTTDKCYQNQEWVWPYRETDPLGGYDPYASSKACAELVAAAYRNSFFSPDRSGEHTVAIATARAGNVIGGGDWSADRLIPDLIRGFRSRQPVLIRNPKAIRPWQHVLDPLHGYLVLAERLLTGSGQIASSYNFGPCDDDIWPVERIVTDAARLWGEGAAWLRDDSANPHEARLLRLDSSRARVHLAWQPRLNTQAALESTLAWYRAYEDGRDMRRVTLAQIAAFRQSTS
jgi:CDP-glucose 4,6-dehydratase